MNRKILVLLFSISCTANGFGDTLISTQGQTPGWEVAFGNTLLWEATDFLTGPNDASITAVTLRLKNLDTISHTVVAGIWSDSSGLPGSLLTTFDVPISIPSNSIFANYTATDSGILLTANTTYWLGFRLGENAVFNSLVSSGASGQDVNPGGVFSGVASTFTQLSFNGGSTWNGPDDFTPIYQLEGTVVPEPSTLGLMIAGLAVAICFRRRRLAS